MNKRLNRAVFNAARRPGMVARRALFLLAADVPDGVHPRPAYSERLALRLAETLDKLAPECAS